MANQLKRLLRRRPELDEAEFEILQSKVLARLNGATGAEAAAEEVAQTPPSASDVDPTAAAPIDDLATNGHLPSGNGTTYELPENAIGVMAEPGAAVWEADLQSMPQSRADAADAPASEPALPVTAEEASVAVMARADTVSSRAGPSESIVVRLEARLPKTTKTATARPRRRVTGPETVELERGIAGSEATNGALESPEPEAVIAGRDLTSPEAITAEPASFEPTGGPPGPSLATPARAAKARLRRRPPEPSTLPPNVVAPEPQAIAQEAADPAAGADPMPLEALPRPAVRPSTPRSVKPVMRRPAVQAPPRAHVAVAPYCPYCALLLDPPPEATRRCPRCRERIIVKRVDGRTIYLTEASVLVFDAERRRMANAGRWTRERGRWLKVAASVGAPAERIAKLEAAPLSEELVAAAHALYSSTVDRSFRAAKREHRWDDASKIMREHAQVLSKLAGSPIPPPDESIRAHQQAAMATLQGVAEMAREAELVSVRCCRICAADHGQTFRIASELRTPRLPHAGCPKGLCRCDWYLAVRDQGVVRRHLRRRARADVPVAGERGQAEG